MKFLILILISFSVSAHNSKGNGGLGYKCLVNQQEGNFVTLTLEIAENIQEYYKPGYFINYNHENNFVAKIFNHTRELRANYNNLKTVVDKSKFHLKLFPIGYEKFQPIILSILENRVDPTSTALDSLFSNREMININNAYDKIADKTSFNFLQHWGSLKNFTEDEGVNKVNLELLAKYGLTKCKMIQIAHLQKIDLDGSDQYYVKRGYEYILNFLIEPMLYMDYLNLESLIWHEVIYLGLGDKNSERTRDAVSDIMKKYSVQ